jgi:hypothetical protein
VYTDEAMINVDSVVFIDPDGDTLIATNYTTIPIPPAMMMVYNIGETNFTFTTLNNSFAGVYAVTLHTYDYASTADEHTSQTFTLTLLANQGPVANETISDLNATVHLVKTYQFTSFIFSDPESEAWYLTSYSVNPPSALIVVNTASRVITVDSSSTASDIGTYVVTLSATDGHPDTIIGTTTVNVNIVANSGPVVNETLPNLQMTSDRTDTRVLSAFAFSDPDGETVYSEGSFTPAVAFLSYDNTTRTITSTATSVDIGTHSFTLTGYDGHPETFNITQTVNISSQF